MNIIFSSKGIELTDAMKQYATKRFSKITKYYPKAIELKIIFKIEKFRHIVDAIISLGPETIKVSKESKDIYGSIDMASELLERKVKRFKDKYSNNKSDVQIFEIDTTSKDDEMANRIIYKTYMIKPMHIEDALMKLKNDNKLFLVFTNAETLKTSILYKNRKGIACIIETS